MPSLAFEAPQGPLGDRVSPPQKAKKAKPNFPYFDLTRAIRESTLGSTDRHILTVFLAYLNGQMGSFCPSLARVARETGYELRTVQIHVARLRRLGWLVLVGVSSQYGTNVYRLGSPPGEASPPDPHAPTPDPEGAQPPDPRSAYLHPRKLHVCLHPDAPARPPEPTRPEPTQGFSKTPETEREPELLPPPGDPVVARAEARILACLRASPRLQPAAELWLARRIAYAEGRRVSLPLIQLALEQLATKIGDSLTRWTVDEIRQSAHSYIHCVDNRGRSRRADEDLGERPAPLAKATLRPAPEPRVPESLAARASGGRGVLAALQASVA